MKKIAATYRPALVSILLLAFVNTAAFAAETREATPTLAKDVVVSACLDAVNRQQTPDARQCPGFVVESLQSASQTCREAGGTLVAGPEQAIWELDVNGDRQPEMTFSLEGNVTCENASSVFSCGSPGCPTPLYQLQNGKWQAIGEIDTPTMKSVSILGASPGQYGTLRIGCSGTDECVETWYYLWTGNAYEKTYVDVRGHRVNFADSVHGPYTLVTITRLLSIPEGGANFVARYPGDTEVAVVGTSEKGDYYYVSPCNACESGFVEKSAVRPR